MFGPAAGRGTAGYQRTVGAYRRSVPGGAELKYKDTTSLFTTDASTGQIAGTLNGIAQGTTDVTRIGNKITVTSIHLRLLVAVDDWLGAYFNGVNCRIIVYVDRQCNGLAAAVTDILKTASILSWRNLDQADRFQILKDKIYTGTPGASNDAHSGACAKIYKWNKLIRVPIHFSGTTGATTEIRSNNIGILCISDTAAANCTIFSRIRYLDA